MKIQIGEKVTGFRFKGAALHAVNYDTNAYAAAWEVVKETQKTEWRISPEFVMELVEPTALEKGYLKLTHFLETDETPDFYEPAMKTDLIKVAGAIRRR